MTIRMKQPARITPRLLPGVRVGYAWVSIDYDREPGDEGRTRYRYHIDLPGGVEHSADDLQSGCQGGSLQEGLASLLAFLSACAESVSYASHAGENAELFPPAIGKWAAEYDDELSMLVCEFDENPGLIVEV